MLDMPNGQTVATSVIENEGAVGMLSVLGPSRSPPTLAYPTTHPNANAYLDQSAVIGPLYDLSLDRRSPIAAIGNPVTGERRSNLNSMAVKTVKKPSAEAGARPTLRRSLTTQVKQRVFDHGTVGRSFPIAFSGHTGPPIDQKQVVVVPFLVQETGQLATGHPG
jgi:hypothetical protein